MEGKISVFMVLLLVAATSPELGWCWSEAMANAKEHLNIAANWAQERFSGGGVTTDAMKDKAADTAAGAKGAMNSAGSDASEKATTVGKMGSNHEDNEQASRSTLEGTDDKFDELKNSYDDTMKKVEDSYHSAIDSISEKSKQTYESAKEMASDAAATVGAKMKHAGEL